MDDTTLIDFSGVIVITLVLWFSGNIYLALAFFALALFFLEKGFAVFQVTHFAIGDQQNNFLPSECLPEQVSRLRNNYLDRLSSEPSYRCTIPIWKCIWMYSGGRLV